MGGELLKLCHSYLLPVSSDGEEAAIELSFLISLGMMESRNGKDQGEAFNYQIQSECDYCHRQQSQSGSQIVLSCLKKKFCHVGIFGDG